MTLRCEVEDSVNIVSHKDIQDSLSVHYVTSHEPKIRLVIETCEVVLRRSTGHHIRDYHVIFVRVFKNEMAGHPASTVLSPGLDLSRLY